MTKTIILACVGGLTTSMLVERINETIHKDQLDYSFYSVGITGINNLKNIDVLLLSPQLAYLEEKAKANLSVPVGVISDSDFELMQGEAVLRQAETLMGLSHEWGSPSHKSKSSLDAADSQIL